MFGFEYETIKTAEYVDMFSPNRKMTEKEYKEIWDKIRTETVKRQKKKKK